MTRAQELFNKAMDQVRWYDSLWVRLKWIDPLWFAIGFVLGVVAELAYIYLA